MPVVLSAYAIAGAFAFCGTYVYPGAWALCYIMAVSFVALAVALHLLENSLRHERREQREREQALIDQIRHLCDEEV